MATNGDAPTQVANVSEPSLVTGPALHDELTALAKGLSNGATVGGIMAQGCVDLILMHAEASRLKHKEMTELFVQSYVPLNPVAILALPQRCADASLRHWQAESATMANLMQDLFARALSASMGKDSDAMKPGPVRPDRHDNHSKKE